MTNAAALALHVVLLMLLATTAASAAPPGYEPQLLREQLYDRADLALLTRRVVRDTTVYCWTCAGITAVCLGVGAALVPRVAYCAVSGKYTFTQLCLAVAVYLVGVVASTRLPVPLLRALELDNWQHLVHLRESLLQKVCAFVLFLLLGIVPLVASLISPSVLLWTVALVQPWVSVTAGTLLTTRFARRAHFE
jgi:hypothetical protein